MDKLGEEQVVYKGRMAVGAYAKLLGPSCGVKLRAAKLIASPIAVPCLEINEGFRFLQHY